MYSKLKEKWLPCKDYEELYMVSNKGRVRSLIQKTRIRDKTANVILQKIDSHGYKRVNLHKNGKQKAELVSRLVLKTFIPNPDNLPMAGHKDDNKFNNTVRNLYWTNALENNFHNGKYEKFLKAHNDKIDIIAKKLSKPVIAINLKTNEHIKFNSMQEAHRILGLQHCKISACCHGKRKSTGGYKFKWQK